MKTISYYKTVKSFGYECLLEDPFWVMNVVPVQAKVHTHGSIYQRGLVGIYHDW